MERLRTVSRDCELPGGVALASYQQKLYAGDIQGRKIWVYEIAGDGTLRGGQVFAWAHANGLKTDEMGNVWSARIRPSLSSMRTGGDSVKSPYWKI